MRPPRSRSLVLLAVALATACASTPRETHRLREVPRSARPRILCVVAHPDDEIAFAGTLYKTATLLGGICDVLVITNGEGGFKYSTLAEPVYGLELTDEEIGREHLPDIRARELLAGCKLLGVRDVTFLGQADHRYTQDPMEVLAEDADVWDLTFVRTYLRATLQENDYDFVLTLAPTPETHGHHKAATILALEAATALEPQDRPVVLCCRTAGVDDPPPTFAELEGFPITRPRNESSFVFDRTQPFGYRGRLSYEIVVNWAIAEHKSQGTMQLLMGRGDHEHYFVFAASPPGAEAATRELFRTLEEPQYEPRTYGESAGTNTAAERAR